MLNDLFNATSPDQISQVISHSIAPSFLLGVVASFVSMLFTRLTNILGRIRDLNELPAEAHPKSHLKDDLPRLRCRARLVNRAMLYVVASGVVATVLVIFSFASAFFGRQHVFGAGLLFTISLVLLGVALLTLAREVRIALNDYDHHAVNGGSGMQ